MSRRFFAHSLCKEGGGTKEKREKSPPTVEEESGKLPKIAKSIEIQASKDRVWDIISDLQHEPDYWYGTREVKMISRNGNEIEREIIQRFRNSRTVQRAVLYPKDAVEIRYLKGLTQGVKRISIESIAEDRQRLWVQWDVHFSGMYSLATYFIKRHTEQGTIHALERIKRVAETQSKENNQSNKNNNNHLVTQ